MLLFQQLWWRSVSLALGPSLIRQRPAAHPTCTAVFVGVGVGIDALRIHLVSSELRAVLPLPKQRLSMFDVGALIQKRLALSGHAFSADWVLHPPQLRASIRPILANPGHHFRPPINLPTNF